MEYEANFEILLANLGLLWILIAYRFCKCWEILRSSTIKRKGFDQYLFKQI